MEIRVTNGYRNVNEVNEMIALIADCGNRLANDGKFVIAADWRADTAMAVMSPETSDRVHHMLTRSNPRVIRSSILTLADQSLINLQVVRLVREAESTNRRHFTDGRQQFEWLAEVLTEAEATRLKTFLELDG